MAPGRKSEKCSASHHGVGSAGIARSTRGRLAMALVLVAAVAGVTAWAFASPAAAHWTHGNSSCTGKEDPANFAIDTPDHFRENGTTAVPPARGAADLARSYWHGGVGSTASYFLFDSANGGCRSTYDWASNSTFSGWHIRFWEGSQAWPYSYTYSEVWGAGHHDFECWSEFPPRHSSDDYPEAAYKMAQDYGGWHDSSINTYKPPYFFWYTVRDRLPSSGVHCGRNWVDDGLTYHLAQLTGWVGVLNNGG